jgi:hypothetical protein
VRRSPLTIDVFADARVVAAFEGGCVLAAERGGKFYLIQDESTLADLLSEEDLDDFAHELVKVFEFDSAGERDAFSQARGWATEVGRRGRQEGA